MKTGVAVLRHWAIRVLLLAYPARFRRRFGPEVEEAFEDGWREHRGRGRGTAVAFAFRTAVDLVWAGWSERVAGVRRRARRLRHHERDRNTGRLEMGGVVEALWQDVRFGVRSLVRRPGFTGVAVMTLALGIGANSAIFSVVNGVLLRPLPYPEPEGLVRVAAIWDGHRGNPNPMSYPDIEDLRTVNGALENLVGYSASTRFTLTGLGEPQAAPVTRVSEGLLSVFRLTPALGRDIRRDEFGPDAARVVVIGYGFWQRHFGGSADVLTRTLTLDGEAYQIVGVTPDGFDFPEGSELWVPRRINVETCARGCHTWAALGRLAPGATVDEAQVAAERIAENLRDAYPDTNTRKSFAVVTVQDDLVGDVKQGLWVLLGAVGFVLLIACANVANLLLVRASSRRGEVAVRSALGASRGRLRFQVLVESGLLALAGGGLGVALAYGAVGLLRRVSPGTIPRIDQVTVDASVLVFTGGLVVAVTLLFGLVPAARMSRAALRDHMVQGRVGGGHRSRATLLTAEVALSLILLVGAGLLLRTLGRLHSVDVGFETREVVRFSLTLPGASYPTLPEIRTFYRTLEDRIRELPGVADVGSIYGAPFSRMGSSGDVYVQGEPDPPPGQEPGAGIRPVSSGYLETVRIPILQGRGLEPADDVGGEPVAVVNQRFVDRVFHGEDPIGRSVRVTVDMGFGSPYWRIVGVVGNVRSSSLTREPGSEVYVPHGQFGGDHMVVTVRGTQGAAGLLPALREQVRALDPDLPLSNPETLAEVVRRQVAPTRFYLMLITLFAAIAVTLAGVGLYGVVAYLVSRRTREIGLRVALGARRGDIVRLVVGEGLRPAGVGIVVGLVAAFWGTRLLGSLLYDVTPRDPWIFAGVSALLLALVLLASWLPTRAAARIDPTRALRVE